MAEAFWPQQLICGNKGLIRMLSATSYQRSYVSRETLFLCAVLVALQLLDGLLTARGVSILGIESEGNLVIRNLMHFVGVVPALVVVKTIAISIVLTLGVISESVPWLCGALRGLAVVYLGAAVVPWCIINSLHL